MTAYIYALVDSPTGEIGYVGKTIRPNQRLSEHLADINSGSPKAIWVRSIIERGHPPVMTILEECSDGDWPERERYWISECRRRGANLTNVMPGGQGPLGFVPRPRRDIIDTGFVANWTRAHGEPPTIQKILPLFRASCDMMWLPHNSPDPHLYVTGIAGMRALFESGVTWEEVAVGLLGFPLYVWLAAHEYTAWEREQDALLEARAEAEA